jgi:chromosome segregation ATPase
MLKNWFEFTQQLFTLTKDAAESKQQIRELQKEVKELALMMQALSMRFDQMQRDAERDRENLLLRLELALVRAERALPPAVPPQIEEKPKQSD